MNTIDFIIVGVMFLLVFGPLLIFWIQLFLIFKKVQKYPVIFYKMLIFSPLRFGYGYGFWITKNGKTLLKILFKQMFLFESFSKNRFDQSFDKLYRYKDIEKTKDNELISLIKKQKKVNRVYLFLLNSGVLLVILGLTIVILGFLIGIFGGV